MRHLMLIQSAYADPGLSERRLRISLATAVPSLKAQQRKPELRVVVHPSDPCLMLRLAAWKSTGCEVRFLYRAAWQLYGEDWELPDGRKLVSRMDDDDLIATDFCRCLRATAKLVGPEVERALLWPVGYVFWAGRIFVVNRPQNPFVSLWTEHHHDPHEMPHTRYHKEWPSDVVSQDPGWVWVRHGDAATPTLPKYRRHAVPGIERHRFPSSLLEVSHAIATSGDAPGDYTAMRSTK